MAPPVSGPFGSHVAGLGVLPHAAGVAHGRPAAVEALRKEERVLGVVSVRRVEGE